MEKKKRISKRMLMAWFDKNAKVGPLRIPGFEDSNAYYSKIDGSYIAHVGLEEEKKIMLRLGITEQIQSAAGNSEGTSNIGFNPDEKKWYGWSHRAIFGFGVGSTCKKGDCHYNPSTPQELLESVTTPDEDGWAWQKPEDIELIEKGIRIKAGMVKPVGGGEPVGADIANACDEVVDAQSGAIMDFEEAEPEYFDILCGKGEWEAKSLDDARQMAVDFANGVS